MILVSCKCGRTLELEDRLAGRFARCPGCGGTVSIPERPPTPDDVEPPPDRSPLDLSDRKRPPRPAPVPVPPPGKRGPPPPSVPCPRCGELYGTDAIFCPKCAVMLATGEPIAGVVPGGMKASKPPRRGSRAWIAWLVILAVLAAAAAVAIRKLA